MNDSFHSPRNPVSRSRTHLLWLLACVIAALAGFQARGVVEFNSTGGKSAAPVAAISPPDLLGLLAGPAKASFPTACPVCGSRRDSYAQICSANKVCFDLVRCTKCGMLAFLQVDLEGKALVGKNGVPGLVDAGGNIVRGEDAARMLHQQGKMGAVLESSPNGVPRVRALFRGAAAETAGMKVGDEILKVGGVDCTVSSNCDNMGTIFSSQAGPKVAVMIRRDGRVMSLVVAR